ncbi:MAG: glycosyltransferase family 39 protein [Anaerolineae bacterium]
MTSRWGLWALAAGVWLLALLVLLLSPTPWLRWLAMMALAWWLPGALLVALWRLSNLDLPAASVLATGLGLCWLVLGALVVHWLPGPIDLSLLIGAYALGAAALLVGLALRRPEPLPVSPTSRSTWGWMAGLLLLAALLRLPGIGYHEFHTDEVFLLRRVVWAVEGQDDALTRHAKGPGQIVATIPGYRALGTTDEFAARLPFGLMSVASVLAVAVLGRRLLSPAVGVWAGVLFAANGFALGLSRIVQYQAAVLLLSALAVLAAWEFAQRGEGRWLALAAVFSAFGLVMHYEYGLLAPALLYLAWLGWKRAADRRRLTLMVLGVGLAGTLLVAAAYVPLILGPRFAETQSYLGNRVGGLGAFNLAFFVEMGTFYNASYYFFGLIGLMLAGLVVGWRTARRATVMLVLWFVPFFILLVFIMRFPGTHFYQMMESWVLLAALPLAVVTQSTNMRPVIRGGLLTLAVAWLVVSAGYLYLIFFRQDPEYLVNYDQERVPFYWAPYGQDVPQQPRFGFPIYEGWKALGMLAEWGCLQGTYASNERSHSLQQWYVEDLRRVEMDASPDFFFLPRHLQEPDPRFDDDLLAGYLQAGAVRVREEPRIEIWARQPLPVPYVEYQAEAFDAIFDRTVPALEPEPQPAAMAGEVPLDPAVTLVVAAVDRTELHPGDVLHLRLVWRPQQALAQDYKVFVHLAAEDGQPVAQWDGLPCFNLGRTSRWAVGQEVTDHVLVPLPAGTPAGIYSLLVGLYDGASGERLGGRAIDVAAITVR